MRASHHPITSAIPTALPERGRRRRWRLEHRPSKPIPTLNPSHYSIRPALIPACLLAASLSGPAHAVNGTWTNLNGGSWATAANWSGGIIATGTSSTAFFNTLSLTANATLTLDGARTIGNLIFDDKAATTHAWRLNTGTGDPLTLDVSSGSPGISNAVTTTLGVALAGTKGLIKSGGGTLILTNANSYSGATTINLGILDLQNALALGSSSVTIPNTNGAILQLDGGITVSGSPLLDFNTQSGANGLQGGAGTNVWAGPITLGSSGARIGSATGAVLNVTGVIDSGANAYDLRIRGQQANPPGIVLLSATNTYGGNTLVNVGVLQLGNVSALPPTTAVQLGIGVGGSCGFDLAGYSPLISGLANLPSQTFYGFVTNSSATPATLAVSNNTPNTYSGNIVGNLALTKLGTDILTLASNCIYTGATVVSNGTLLIAGSIAGGPVTVAAGTLGGVGAIGGAVTVQSGSSLSPGNPAIGTLTINNSLTLDPGSTTIIGLDKGNAQPTAQVAGVTTLTEGGTLQINNTGFTLLAAGDNFPVFSAGSYASQFSAFSPANPNSDTSLNWDTNLLATTGRLAVVSNGTTGSVQTIAISNSAGVIVTADSTGVYTVNSHSPAWTFGGHLGSAAANLATGSGVDGVGGYSEITFYYTNTAGQFAGIRAYSNQPVILFSETYLTPSPNNLAFPSLTLYPTNLYHLSYNGAFGIYDFSGLHSDSPWLFFDTNFNAFIISPAANYMIAKDVGGANNAAISCGIDPAVTNLPASFTHRAMLVITNGINRAFETWGNALTGLSGKIRPANDAALELNKLGYWTDNGAVYYYNYDANRGYPGTLLAVRDEFVNKGLPLGYLQLDSWWYPKSQLDTWQGTTTNSRGGIYLYVAAPELFTNGLAPFQQQLGLPLVTHARWVDPASPYRTNYNFSLDVPVDQGYWTNIMGYIASGGVVTYEQDWLNHNMLPATNLYDPPAYMNQMASAAASNGLNMQYCLALPRHYLQGSLYNNLLTMRVSNDHFTASEWNHFLYDSRFVNAVGAWPWCDVFNSGEERDLVLSTLSGGIVGVGDGLGAVNATNLLKAARPDAVLVKPDTPILPVDNSYLNDAQGKNLPLLSSTYTDHNGLRAFYVYAFARQSTNATASFIPSSLGIPGDAYVYDYFNNAGTRVSSGLSYSFTTTLANTSNGGSYFIVIPIGPSGIALLGDTNKYVSLGKKRISALSDSGTLSATIQFASGEQPVSICGYSPSTPFISATGGSVNPVSYDSSSHFFTINITPGPSQSATLTFTLRPILQTSLASGHLQLSWPAVSGPMLQTAPSLAPPVNWTPVTNTVVTIGGVNTVTVDTSQSAAFFRLQQ